MNPKGGGGGRPLSPPPGSAPGEHILISLNNDSDSLLYINSNLIALVWQ